MPTKPFSPPPLLVIALATVAGMLSTTMVANLADRFVSPSGGQSVAPADARPAVQPTPTNSLRRAAVADEIHDQPIVTPG